jgi:ABC-type multidrug transport system ATPase subunit
VLDTYQFKRVFNQERVNRSVNRPNFLDDQSTGLLDNSNVSVIKCSNLFKTINEKKNLCKTINRKKIVEEISFDIKQSEILGIIGPSGAGKSTLFKILTMMEKRDSGEVVLDGISIDNEDGQYAAA